MNTDRRYDTGKLLEFPIAEVLSHYGKARLFRATAEEQRFFSPFRDERTASFSVKPPPRNTWYDFGAGEGGGIVDLVMRLEGISDRAEATKRLAAIAEAHGVNTALTTFAPVRREWKVQEPSERGCLVDSVRSVITDPNLREYVRKRGVSLDLVDRYCYEVTFHYRKTGNTFNVVGFPNTKQGYTFRSPAVKVSSSGAYTCISIDGKYDRSPSCRSVTVFEGFFDFLSFMELRRLEVTSGRFVGGMGLDTAQRRLDLLPPSDIVVLNSTGNLPGAAEYLSAHGVIHSYLDYDRGGHECFVKMVEACPGSSVVDHSSLFAPCDDYNEYLMKVLPEFGRPLTRSVQM